MSVRTAEGVSLGTSLATVPEQVSNFTIRDLLDLNDPQVAYKSPLSVIALVDLNAFFAQVERVRLGLSDDDPIVCQQWQSIIAVSYAAREFGISRMDTIHSARLKCPDLVAAHAGVYKKGDSHWAYYPGSPSPVDHKVSLDSYRRESRKVLRIIQSKFDLVEKASVDESYIDLGRPVYRLLLEKFPALKEALNKTDNKQQRLPSIPSVLPSDVQWEGYIAESEKEAADLEDIQSPEIKDWDDVILILGSQLLLDLRRTIYDELGYTTSAGLARNKLVAKLSGGFKKPDNQTIVRNCAINKFLNNFELTDITGLGGKLGSELIRKFEVPPESNSIAFIRENYSSDMLHEMLSDDPELARKLYHIVRGLCASELTSKVDVKSMTSTKNFRDNSPSSLKDAYEWLTVFAGDLSNRLLDLDNESMDLSITKVSKRERGVLRRPKTITIGIRSTAYVRQTRQMSISFYKDINKMKQVIEECGFQLLRDYMEHNTDLSGLNGGKPVKELFLGDAKDVRIMKMQNMSLAISNFVALHDNAFIESFVKERTGDDSHTVKQELMEINNAFKRRKLETADSKKQKELSTENKSHISNLFKEYKDNNDQNRPQTKQAKVKPRANRGADIFQTLKKRQHLDLLSDLIATKFCKKCNLPVDDPIEHNDYHIAIDLSDRWNQ
ncbi:eso1 [Candida oxycetoniae]|uniref:DNA polymerase eta n=1 Tax=Candida oxycetoniae TaxID=497107 RepID=A0AAI9SX30_9ASCO|nr:eso1 [Candida oxycetoniae]KAI3404699.2 eso1 [Candida oxycetoniae]